MLATALADQVLGWPPGSRELVHNDWTDVRVNVLLPLSGWEGAQIHVAGERSRLQLLLN